MRHVIRLMSCVVVCLALPACGQRVIVFEAVGSDAGATPFVEDPFDAAVGHGDLAQLHARTDVPIHSIGPIGGAIPDAGPMFQNDADDGLGDCATDPRVDEYASNLTKLGNRRALRFVLVESRPAPPSVGSSVLTLRIVTSDSAPRSGDGKPFRGDLRASVTMPDHAHTTVPPTITLDTSVDVYTVNSAYFLMPGVWRIEFAAYDAPSSEGDAPVDTVSYHFCVVPRGPTLGPGGL